MDFSYQLSYDSLFEITLSFFSPQIDVQPSSILYWLER